MRGHIARWGFLAVFLFAGLPLAPAEEARGAQPMTKQALLIALQADQVVDGQVIRGGDKAGAQVWLRT